MYKPFGSYGRAGAQYRQIDVSTRVEGASPHRLVAILYEELLVSIATMGQAIRVGDIVRRGESQSKALAIVGGLESGLDFEQGGEIARLMVTIYAETKRLLIRAARENDMAPSDEARKLVAEIATAWNAIA
ncbi:flagellar export chaperone FliS [Sphingomonas solaris]|uniref:Flagellar secretion chaperone FliS n=1 Tax=Alterirhizorhabdus solaris TaxID=2529389 RepID=A0A558R1B2_9SPHN|nr:flagellar export chaperone FliS [Sphingomonas solaris]TVV73181.1 flagellar export chaperone FliS [Sphingomonas solaris]